MPNQNFRIIWVFLLGFFSACRTIPGSKSVTESVSGAGASSASGIFDYYILALDWHPQFCKSKAKVGECGRGFGFALHGLWPQFETLHGSKDYPEDCSGPAMTEQVAIQFPNLYPGHSLLMHEWDKHGTCTGLSPVEYLKLAQRALSQVVIPQQYISIKADIGVTVPQLLEDFESANSGFEKNQIAVNCGDGGSFLQTVYFCLGKADLAPRACPDVIARKVAHACKNNEFTVTAPPAR